MIDRFVKLESCNKFVDSHRPVYAGRPLPLNTPFLVRLGGFLPFGIMRSGILRRHCWGRSRIMSLLSPTSLRCLVSSCGIGQPSKMIKPDWTLVSVVCGEAVSSGHWLMYGCLTLMLPRIVLHHLTLSTNVMNERRGANTRSVFGM